MNLALLWEIFCMFLLNEIMHHIDNKAFSMPLNNMALGMMSDEDLFLTKK
jgi:hypothetical protein